MSRVATAVWTIRPDLIVALDAQLGVPVDSYVNGSQTWFTESGSAELEWRLHPVAGYRQPAGVATDELWDTVVDQLNGGAEAAQLPLGSEPRSLDGLWEGLECYVSHGPDLEPAVLATAAAEVLGLAPDASGMVDHEPIADAWERTRGAVSIIGLLFDQLRA